MPKRLSPQAILALQEALAVVYHYKNDLRRFLTTCGIDAVLLAQVDWARYKRQIVADLFELFLDEKNLSLQFLTSLCRDVAAMDNFAHLAVLEDGARKVATAQAAVTELRRLVDRHETQEEDERLAAERRQRLRDSQNKLDAFETKLRQIRALFQSVGRYDGNPQKRGAELEALMNDLFSLFDLDPKASFRIKGEQIDGAFTLDGTDYLFEAKWEKEPVDRAALDEFVSKIGRKLDNTLGLLLSMSGFMPNAIELHSGRRATLLLMDSYDLQAVLEQRIDFIEMLRRKRRHAAETGSIFFQIYPTVV
jgi:hypothetical protein